MGLPPVLGVVEKRPLEMPPADFVRAVAEVGLLVFATPPRKDVIGVFTQSRLTVFRNFC